eukprot:5534460-Amphidinium_carterae.1
MTHLNCSENDCVQGRTAFSLLKRSKLFNLVWAHKTLRFLTLGVARPAHHAIHNISRSITELRLI